MTILELWAIDLYSKELLQPKKSWTNVIPTLGEGCDEMVGKFYPLVQRSGVGG